VDILSSKTIIGVVVKANKLVMSKRSSSQIKWANSYVNVETVTDYDDKNHLRGQYTGKSDTAAIVAAHPNDTASNNAAKYCNSYSTAGTSAGNWYLPSGGELFDYFSSNQSILKPVFANLGWSTDSLYWSTSENSAAYAWQISFESLYRFTERKDLSWYVSCYLEI